MDGEHQGPVAGVQLHEHGCLDQVLGQVAQERDGPARQATRPRSGYLCLQGKKNLNSKWFLYPELGFLFVFSNFTQIDLP